MGDRKAGYDETRRARAGGTAALRALAAAYLVYLAWQIAAGVRSGKTTMTPLVGYAAAAFFLLAAAVFTVYLIRHWRLEVEAARLPEADETEDSAEEET